MSWSPDAYLSAVNFASQAHLGQRVPGSDEPYLRHVITVAAEIMSAIALRGGDVELPDLAVQCALLHDCVEDTDTELEELVDRFGDDVAAGVSALTKNPSLPTKTARMADSLRRIRQQPAEVWMVKMADRITNLQTPPGHWSESKVLAYRSEALEIHAQLAGACSILAARLAAKIACYPPTDR